MPQSISPDYHFCPRCAEPLKPVVRGGLPRPSCAACGFVHFRNPVVGVAVVLRDDSGRILLGRRSAGGNVGEWCIPCGYVEWGEDIRDAARREFQEETGIDVEIGDVLRRPLQLPQHLLPDRGSLVLRQNNGRPTPSVRRPRPHRLVPSRRTTRTASLPYRPPGPRATVLRSM